MSYYTEAIIKHIITNVATEGKEDYQKFFSAAMKKFGVSSPTELSGEKKKEFFDYIDNNYEAQNEEAPKGWEGTVKAMKDNEDIDNPYALAHWMKNKGYKSHKKEFVEYMKLKRNQYSEASSIRDKTDAYSAAMNSLDKYFLNVAAVPAPKKAKKVSKIMSMLQKTFFSKDESVNESIKDSDVILVRSMWTEKERDVRKALAKDRKVAKHIGKNDIDVYFDDNELVAGGDSGNTIVVVRDGWTLGDLKKAILKKNPRKWQESIEEVAMPLGSYLEHAMNDVDHLIDVVKSEHAENAYSSPKKSEKLLVAVKKLLKKVK